MKTLVLYICIIALVPFISADIDTSQKIFSTSINYNTCLTENNAVDDDIYTMQDVIDKVFEHPEQSERKLRKNSCMVQCVLEKANLMEGWEFKEGKILTEFIKKMSKHSESTSLTLLNACITETKHIPDKCDKGFGLVVCYMVALHRLQ